MNEYINTRVLRYGEIRLGKWTRSTPPRRTSNLLRAVINYARFMGLPAISDKTVKRLKDDPYFKYAFTRVMYRGTDMCHDAVYDNQSVLGKLARGVLDRIINNPDAVTAEDLNQGIQLYIDNFSCNMPNGFNRSSLDQVMKRLGKSLTQKEQDEEQGKYSRLFVQIDKILEEKGIRGKTLSLKADAEEERRLNWDRFDKRLDFTKLCLEIFQILVQKYGYAPEFLGR